MRMHRDRQLFADIQRHRQLLPAAARRTVGRVKWVLHSSNRAICTRHATLLPCTRQLFPPNRPRTQLHCRDRSIWPPPSHITGNTTPATMPMLPSAIQELQLRIPTASERSRGIPSSRISLVTMASPRARANRIGLAPRTRSRTTSSTSNPTTSRAGASRHGISQQLARLLVRRGRRPTSPQQLA